MKKKIFSFIVALMVFSSVFAFAGCRSIVSYIAMLPEESYEADLIYTHNDHVERLSIVHRNETITGEEHTVCYLKYKWEEDDWETYLGVFDGSDWIIYILNGASWEKGSQSNTYGSDYYNFVQITNLFLENALKTTGNDFRTETLVIENEEYLEYNRSGDIFRISNNIYHVCLYMQYNLPNTLWKHEFTRFTFNESTTEIPYLATVVL